jgi:hypothetical protein
MRLSKRGNALLRVVDAKLAQEDLTVGVGVGVVRTNSNVMIKKRRPRRWGWKDDVHSIGASPIGGSREHAADGPGCDAFEIALHSDIKVLVHLVDPVVEWVGNVGGTHPQAVVTGPRIHSRVVVAADGDQLLQIVMPHPTLGYQPALGDAHTQYRLGC